MRTASETKSKILAILSNGRKKSPKWAGFTLVELIVVITILAILATVGFLALSGYTSDAKDAAIKANVRSVITAISSESAISWNSPRYYVTHDADAALTGAFVYVDGTQTYLTGWNYGDAGTNYTAGNPDYVRLKLNADKFKVSASRFANLAAADYDSKFLSVGAFDAMEWSATARPRPVSWFQVAWVDPNTKKAVVMGNFPNTFSSGGSSAGLIRDPAGSATGAVIDEAIAGTVTSDTSPSGPTDSLFSSVSLLLHGDGTNGGQNNAFVDSSANALTVTRNGNVSQWTLSPFVTWGGSAYFDGVGDYLQIANVPSLQLTSAGGFTIETWFNPASTSQAMLLTWYPEWGPYNGWALAWWRVTAGQLEFYDGATWRVIANSVPTNAWHHVAVSNSWGTGKFFLNGIQQGTDFTVSANIANTSTPIAVWRLYNTTAFDFKGYLSNARITKGVWLYSGWTSFAVPTSPLNTGTNTSLLLNFADASVVDSSRKWAIETVGDAKISTAQSVFWGSSLGFDGTGDFLDLSYHPWQNLWTSDWTVETWVRFNNVSTMYQGVFSKDDFQWMALQLNEQSADAKLAFWMDTTGATPWDFWGTYGKKTTTVFAANQWYHVAITRQGSNLRFYVNGVLDWSDTVTGSVYNSTGPLHIGRSQLSTRYMNGNIDDFRVTSGTARYTGTGFAIPTSAYPNQ